MDLINFPFWIFESGPLQGLNLQNGRKNILYIIFLAEPTFTMGKNLPPLTFTLHLLNSLLSKSWRPVAWCVEAPRDQLGSPASEEWSWPRAVCVVRREEGKRTGGQEKEAVRRGCTLGCAASGSHIFSRAPWPKACS